MRFDELKNKQKVLSEKRINDLIALGKTQMFQNKIDESLRDIEMFLVLSKKPAISCGGGKDSTASVVLVNQVDPSIPIYCANYVDPLPGRDEHIEKLKKVFPNKWNDVKYWWDIEAFLLGRLEYPAGLKMRLIDEAMKKDNVDGVIMGIRMKESMVRRITGYKKGSVYQIADGSWRCCPVLRWTAEETLCLLLLFNIPIHPVYYQNLGVTNLEHLRDGTWNGMDFTDKYGYGEWLKYYHPEYYEKFKQGERRLETEDK